MFIFWFHQFFYNILFKYIMYEIHFSSLKNIFYIFFSEIQKIKPQIFNTFKLEYELPSNKFVN